MNSVAPRKAGSPGRQCDGHVTEVLDLLTPGERRRLLLVFAGVLAAALLETAGVASALLWSPSLPSALYSSASIGLAFILSTLLIRHI